MLNFKKGLALVLAAATAFTFAPVANLGVTANAASTDSVTSITVPAAAFVGDADETVNAGITNGVTKVYAVQTGRGFYFDDVVIKAQPGHTYQLITQDGVSVYKNNANTSYAGTADPTDAAITQDQRITTKNGSASGTTDLTDNDGNIKVDIWVSTPGTKTIVFADRTTTGQASGNISNQTLKISFAKNASDISSLDITTAQKQTFTANSAVYTSNNTSIKNNNDIYAMSMNDTDGYYIDLSTTAAVKVTAWNGVDVTGSDATAAKVTFTDDSKTLTVEPGKKYGAASTDTLVADTDYVRLIPTAPTTSTLNLVATAKVGTETVATKNLPFAVDKSANAIDTLTFTDNYGNTTVAPYATVKKSRTGLVLTKVSDANYTLNSLDKQVHSSGQFTVKAESSDISFKSEDSSIVAVDENGKVTVNGVGTTKIYIFVGSTQNNKALTATVTVNVTDWADDELTVDATNGTDLDVSSQTAANVVKTTTLKVTSAAGLKTTIEQTSGTDFATLDPTTGVITSKDKAGKATFKVTSATDTTKKVIGSTVTKDITVWTLPAAVFTVDPVTVEAGKSVMLTANVTSPNPYSIVWNSDDSGLYTLSNAQQTGILHNNTQTTSKLTANATIGTGKIKATVLGTTATRPTTKEATVTVLNKAAVNTITLDDNSKSLVLEEGATAQLSGKASMSGKTVTFEGGDANVATVTTSGAVTAVKAGKTTIKAVSEGAESVEIPVVVTAKAVVYADPAKVTGVKVSNAKGAKVTVKYTKDTTAPTMKYYVQKKVSGKTAGKSVGSTKTTLSVKKGAKVMVRVKAYYYDANGVKHVGKYSAWKTLKTDKK